MNLLEEYIQLLLKETGYTFATKIRNHPVFIQNDDPNKSNSKKILKLVAKNLNKKAYTLKNPPSMGISIK